MTDERPMCGEAIQVGRLLLLCRLPPRDSAHTRGITDGVVHEAEHRNVGVRVLIQWEGQP